MSCVRIVGKNRGRFRIIFCITSVRGVGRTTPACCMRVIGVLVLVVVVVRVLVEVVVVLVVLVVVQVRVVVVVVVAVVVRGVGRDNKRVGKMKLRVFKFYIDSASGREDEKNVCGGVINTVGSTHT